MNHQQNDLIKHKKAGPTGPIYRILKIGRDGLPFVQDIRTGYTLTLTRPEFYRPFRVVTIRHPHTTAHSFAHWKGNHKQEQGQC